MQAKRKILKAGAAMDIAFLQSFREVALRQNITRAAEQLGYAQSTVTMQIQKLEKEFGVQLFERYGRGLRLTSAGQELLKVAGQMLELYDESRERLTEHRGGTLLIGAIDSVAAYVLPRPLQQLRRQYPDLSIRLETGREPQIMDKVREGELDVGLILECQQADPSLQWTSLREEPLVLIANPTHPLSASQALLELEQLAGEEWIMTEESCNYRLMLEKLLRHQGIPYRIGLELGNPEAIKRCVRTGPGIALLPRMAVEEELRSGQLTALPFTHPELRLELQLMHHPRKWISHPLRDWISLLQSVET